MENDISVGDGRSTIWLDRSIPLYFKFYGSKVPVVNAMWLEKLTVSANSGTGLLLMSDPGGSCASLASGIELGEIRKVLQICRESLITRGRECRYREVKILGVVEPIYVVHLTLGCGPDQDCVISNRAVDLERGIIDSDTRSGTDHVLGVLEEGDSDGIVRNQFPAPVVDSLHPPTEFVKLFSRCP
ncbi:MAG: hypothetical protein ABI238_00110 [Terrimesophilobacter sp.]